METSPQSRTKFTFLLWKVYEHSDKMSITRIYFLGGAGGGGGVSTVAEKQDIKCHKFR